MRESLKSTMGWLWLAVFLALPTCSFDVSGLGPIPVFNPGAQPWTSAIFCDVENKDVARRCATADDVANGTRLAGAAIALVRGDSSLNNVGLDYSPAAIAAQGCSPGQPVAITFRGPFPTGTSKCLNCGGVIGPVYASVDAACVDVCRDVNLGGDAFCADPATIHRASTNASTCFPDLCINNALPVPFVDPRSTPEPVSWTSISPSGALSTSGTDSNTLTRMAATTGAFDAGAASTRVITHGDGYVEFTVVETNAGRMCGLSTGAAPDGDPSTADIGFGIRLNATAKIFIAESGTQATGPNPDSSFGTYATGDRLRVSVKDNFDGTGAITYSLIPAACAGAGCDGTVLRTIGGAAYPLRVDASFNQLGGTLSDVRIVRIK